MSNSQFAAWSIFLALLTLQCFSNPTFSYRQTFIGRVKTTDSELNQICSQTQDPSFCLDAFKHDSQTASADQKQICAIGLRLATFVSSNGQSQAKGYAQTVKDPQLQSKYQFCATNYDAILGKFDDAGKSLQSGQFDQVKSAAIEAYSDATQCSKLFASDTVVGEQSRQSETLSQAVIATANRLI